jgi:hypothetical protein
MHARLLPVDEWPRLTGTELEQVWPHLNDDHARIVVVEQDGQIIGCWSAIRYWHVEGAWVHPAHRKRGRVVQYAIALMFSTLRALGAGAVLTGSLTEDTDALIRHLGGNELPGRSFVIPLGPIGPSLGAKPPCLQ